MLYLLLHATHFAITLAAFIVLCGIKKQYHYYLHFNDLLTFFRKGFCTFSAVLCMSNDVRPHNTVIHWCHEIIIMYAVTIPLVVYPAWKRACMVATEYNSMRTDPKRGLVKFHIDHWRGNKMGGNTFCYWLRGFKACGRLSLPYKIMLWTGIYTAQDGLCVLGPKSVLQDYQIINSIPYGH